MHIRREREKEERERERENGTSSRPTSGRHMTSSIALLSIYTLRWIHFPPLSFPYLPLSPQQPLLFLSCCVCCLPRLPHLPLPLPFCLQLLCPAPSFTSSYPMALIPTRNASGCLCQRSIHPLLLSPLSGILLLCLCLFHLQFWQ